MLLNTRCVQLHNIAHESSEHIIFNCVDPARLWRAAHRHLHNRTIMRKGIEREAEWRYDLALNTKFTYGDENNWFGADDNCDNIIVSYKYIIYKSYLYQYNKIPESDKTIEKYYNILLKQDFFSLLKYPIGILYNLLVEFSGFINGRGNKWLQIAVYSSVISIPWNNY